MRACVIALALAACGTADEPASDQPEQPAPAPKPTADTPLANRGYLGVLTPRASHDVLSPFTSTIAELKVRLGDRVEDRQVVARFDDRPLKQQLVAETATLRARDAEAAQAVIELHAAEANLAREQQAFAEKVSPKANVDTAEFAVRKAQAAIAGATARREEQHANIAKLQARLTDTTVLAPAAGRIALLYHREGERVEEGQPVLQIISSDDLYIKFAIPGDQVGTMAVGDEVDVLVEQQNLKARAVVRHVSPALDSVAQMIVADADLVGPPGPLQGGQRCRILPRPKKK